MAIYNNNSVEEIKSNIINMASELFSTVGYHGTTVNMITDRIGIAKGAFYYHFKSKDDVLNAAAEQMVRKEAKILEDIVQSSVDPADKLASILKELANFWHEKESFVKYVDKRLITINHQLKELVMEYTVPSITTILSQGSECGKMLKIEAESTAKLILNNFIFVYETALFKDANEKNKLILACYHMTEAALGLENGTLSSKLMDKAD
jgi:AcrR family transcriptional regulator